MVIEGTINTIWFCRNGVLERLNLNIFQRQCATAAAASEIERGLIRRCRNYSRHERAKKRFSFSLLSLHLNENRNGVIGKICHGMARTSDTFSFWRPRKSPLINLHLSLSPSSLFLTCQLGTALSPRICSSPTEIITLHRIVIKTETFFVV